jgi:hypothetical protein
MLAEADQAITSQECHEVTTVVLFGRLSRYRPIPESGCENAQFMFLSNALMGVRRRTQPMLQKLSEATKWMSCSR